MERGRESEKKKQSVAIFYRPDRRKKNIIIIIMLPCRFQRKIFGKIKKKITCFMSKERNTLVFASCEKNLPTPGKHRHSNSGPPFFLIWSLPRLWYGSLSGSISLNHLSIFYNNSCYNSLVLLTFVSRSSCHITYIYK